MSTATAAKITPEEFLAMPDRGRYELVDGNLVEVNVSILSSRVGMIVGRKLDSYCEANQLGWVWGSDNLVRCFTDPGKFRKPDASFVRLDRIPWGHLEDSFLDLAPDLVVEVTSPKDLYYEVDLKIREYLGAGVRLVWIISPEFQTVRIHRPDGTISQRSAGEELDGEDVILGFRCPVAELFPPIQQS